MRNNKKKEKGTENGTENSQQQHCPACLSCKDRMGDEAGGFQEEGSASFVPSNSSEHRPWAISLSTSHGLVLKFYGKPLI